MRLKNEKNAANFRSLYVAFDTVLLVTIVYRANSPFSRLFFFFLAKGNGSFQRDGESVTAILLSYH